LNVPAGKSIGCSDVQEAESSGTKLTTGVITKKREKNNIISDDDSDNDVPEYNSDDIESNDENGTDLHVKSSRRM